MEVDASLASEVVQDPALDTTPLPADHPAKFLAEARSIYKDGRPPFVSVTSGITEGSEREVFIAKNGQRPLLPVRASLVAKRWDPLSHKGVYWTLDLNGERFIVQSFPNKGCVRGAKWIYCCWSGAGEEFEDLPLAFTCINGEYTCALGLKTDYATEAKRATTKNDLLNTTTANVTPLPEDHPIEYLDEAEALYVKSRPPFVVQQTRLPRRRVLLATEDGRFSATSNEAEVVYRTWDSLDDFPTLDLNGKRFIVMGNAGGPPGGYQYHLWLGSGVGRVKKVIAYSSPHANATREPYGLNEHLSETEEGSNSWSSSDNAEAHDSEVGTTETPIYRYDNFISAFDLTTTLPQAPANFQICRPISAFESSAQKEGGRRISKPTKRARSLTPPTHSGSRKSKTLANVAKRTLQIVRTTKDSTDLPTPASTPNTNNHPSQPSETPNSHTQTPTSLPTLTLYKQTHTTLRVTRDSNIIGFVPLRLLSCMTMSALFISAVAASGHREQDEPIKCLMVVFDWKDENDVYKTMYIDKGTEGSFEIFLEIIDEAPCWKDEGAKCGIAVEIVRASS